MAQIIIKYENDDIGINTKKEYVLDTDDANLQEMWDAVYDILKCGIRTKSVYNNSYDTDRLERSLTDLYVRKIVCKDDKHIVFCEKCPIAETCGLKKWSEEFKKDKEDREPIEILRFREDQDDDLGFGDYEGAAHTEAEVLAQQKAKEEAIGKEVKKEVKEYKVNVKDLLDDMQVFLDDLRMEIEEER